MPEFHPTEAEALRGALFKHMRVVSSQIAGQKKRDGWQRSCK
jgi:hypothetical protein